MRHDGVNIIGPEARVVEGVLDGEAQALSPRRRIVRPRRMPGAEARRCEITHTYGREEALEVIERSMKDYRTKFGKLENKLSVATLEMINFGQSWQQALADQEAE